MADLKAGLENVLQENLTPYQIHIGELLILIEQQKRLVNQFDNSISDRFYLKIEKF